MNKNNLSIATITWARDEGEEALLRESLQHLAKLEIPVFIADGGSNTGFLDFLHGFPHFVLSKEKRRGVFEQVKYSLSKAYQLGSAFIFYTEPDKKDFFQKGLSQMIDQVQADEQSGIIMASRSAAGFATFPAFQQMTETTINNCCKEITGIAVDYTYGPFILNRQLIPYLDLAQQDIGWGWRPYTFGVAHRLGYTIKAFTGDFTCPPLQQEDSHHERIYRMRQLSQNIEGLVLSTNVSL